MNTGIILLGKQGSGKSTVVKHFVRHGAIALSMSEVLDEMCDADPVFERTYDVRRTMASGGLVATKAVFKAMFWKLGQITKGTNLVLDGVVRTTEQAEIVLQVLRKRGYRVHVISLECGFLLAFRRILARRRDHIENGQEIRKDEKSVFSIARRLFLFWWNYRRIVKVFRENHYHINLISARLSRKEIADRAEEIVDLGRHLPQVS